MNLTRWRFAPAAFLLMILSLPVAVAACGTGSPGTTTPQAQAEEISAAATEEEAPEEEPSVITTTTSTTTTTTTTLPPTTEAPPPSEPDYSEEMGGDGSYEDMYFDVRPCSELYHAGEVVRTVFDKFCLDETGAEVVLVTDSWECTDFRTLWSDDYGWGYLDEASHRKAPGETLDIQHVRDCTGTEPQGPPRR